MLHDRYGIGQPACARIQMQVAQDGMAQAAPRAFATGYINRRVMAAARATFAEFRRQYDEAKKVLEVQGV